MDDRRKKHSSSLDLMDRIVQAQPFTSESLLKARMKAAAREHRRPFCLRGANGPLMAIYYAPGVAPSPAGDLLFVPPFAEEMNRCRAMVALQARALSE